MFGLRQIAGRRRFDPEWVFGRGNVTCATLADRSRFCWGNGESARRVRLRPGADTLAVTATGICAVSGDGVAFCKERDASDDSAVTLQLRNVHALSIGSFGACAQTVEGQIACWSPDHPGASLRDLFRRAPTEIRGFGLAGGISVGDSHACALTRDGQVWCWGSNSSGELGDGTTVDRASPVRVHGLEDAFGVSARGHHTCAYRSNGSVACWGSNTHGEVGTPACRTDGETGPLLDHTYCPTATDVAGLTDVDELALGDDFSCGRTYEGRVTCWGANGSGQLGIGTTAEGRPRQFVAGLGRIISIEAGSAHVCALSGDRVLSCWGSNSAGQLGDSDPAVRWLPTRIDPL